MIKIDIIGRGNVGWHLLRAFSGKADVKMVAPRTLDGLRNDSELYLLCVNDRAIAEVAKQVAPKISTESILAHTSGTTPLSTLTDVHAASGVFYPLQTFSKGVELEYVKIPIFVEGATDRESLALRHAAQIISENIIDADSLIRRKIHLASVIACNFSNHLWALADSYLNENGLNFNILKPLLRECLRKGLWMPPRQAQTGPAARHDMPTIESNLQMLEERPRMREIYDLLTRSIIENDTKSDNDAQS